MADMITIEATRREVVGKQVKQIRAQGWIPGVLYGPTFEALPLQIEWTTLRPALLEAGGSQIVQLNVSGEEYNALVRDVQRSPMRGDVLHVDFYRVRMDVAIRTEVPISLKGDTEPFQNKGGTIVHEMTSIEVECLPTVLPSSIEVSIESLQEIGDMILVSGLPQLEGVTYMASEDDVVVSTTYLERLVEEEEEEEEELFGEEIEPELIRRGEEDFGDDETEV